MRSLEIRLLMVKREHQRAWGSTLLSLRECLQFRRADGGEKDNRAPLGANQSYESNITVLW